MYMKLIMLGAPGAGKGTQAIILSERNNIPTISTGVIIRAAIKNGTETGKLAKDLIESAELLANTDTEPAITNVNVSNGVLTFDVKNVESGDVWVATYSGTKLVNIQKLTLDNLSCNVGDATGKIFVWDGMTPITDCVEF